MIFAGIDIAKLNHYAAVIFSDGIVLTEPFKFTNDGDGFQKLSSELSDYAPEPVIIGLESTAHYGDNLIRYLVANDYKVCVLNPIQTSSRRKDCIRKTKTDKVDAIVIAETVMMQKSFRFVTFYNLDLMDLKTLGRFRQKSIKQRPRLKIQLTSYVDQVFPELQYFFKSGLHQRSVGNSDSTISIQITQTISQIELLDSQINKVEAEMTEIMNFNDSVIMTIPGIGYINGGMILGEIGDIHRFSKPHKLLAYAGLDPSVHESGSFKAKRTRMSKRGSKVLRYALINAAHNVVKYNATFKAYYDNKMAEGRSHYNALGHRAGKLVRVIWRMMTDDIDFNLD